MATHPSPYIDLINSNKFSNLSYQQDLETTRGDNLDKNKWNHIFPDYNFSQLICQTNNSLVWLGCQKVSSHRVALKITQTFQKGNSMLAHLQIQKTFVKQNHFKYMVKILQIIQTKFYRLIVMDQYPWSLADLLSYYANLRYTKSHLNFIVYAFNGILKSIRHLHQLGYVHRDLKLDNFMLDQNFNIYLNDFELVTKELVVDPSLSGTLDYMAPERLSNKRLTCPVTKKVDIWSLGIILYQLFTGETPYNGQNQDQILEDIYQKYIKVKQIPSEALGLISQLLEIRSEKRPQLQQIINSSFLQKEIDLDQIRGIITQ